jgi:hypothetical protein
VHLWFNKHEGAIKLRVEQHAGTTTVERSSSGKPEAEAPTAILITSITKVSSSSSSGQLAWLHRRAVLRPAAGGCSAASSGCAACLLEAWLSAWL